MKKTKKTKKEQKPTKKNKKLFFVHSSKEGSARSPTSATLSKKLKSIIQQIGNWP
jgi:Mrp family chromosome partitioning ATPase